MEERNITIAVGAKATGKTFVTREYIKEYLRKCYAEGEGVLGNGRKVIIIDPNDEYTDLKSIEQNQFEEWCKASRTDVRRIILNDNIDETRLRLKSVSTYFRSGLIVFEDIEQYLTDKDKDLVSLLVCHRTCDLDIIIHLHSLAALTTRMWQNCSFIRLHYNYTDPNNFISRLRCPDLIIIGSFLTNTRIALVDKYFYSILNLKNCTISGDFSLKYYKDICKSWVKNQSLYKGLFNYFARRRRVKYLLKFYRNTHET